jgi:transcriptional regulator with XRE-family HTH domain
VIRVVDLHPDDTAARQRLGDQLRDARRAAGLSQRDLAARLGVVHSAVVAVEANTSWRMSTLRRWARGLDMELLAHPAGMPELPTEVKALAAMVTADDRGDRFAVAALVAEITFARETLGLTKAEMGRRLGVAARGVSAIENGARGDIMVVTAQRMWRVLDGALVLELGELS